VRRVLRDDGVVWLNLGDSHLPGKQLGMIPARVALALQADGWILRSDVVWSKINVYPESVTDRPTRAHEFVYLFAKQKCYFFDADAVAEPVSDTPYGGNTAVYKARPGRGFPGGATRMRGGTPRGDKRNIRSVWTIATRRLPGGAHFATMPEKLVERCVLAGSRNGDVVLDPFMGSGTVARVALRLGRRAMGCDLNLGYLKLADARTQVTYGLPLEGEDVA
jgi:DNA modification methylase